MTHDADVVSPSVDPLGGFLTSCRNCRVETFHFLTDNSTSQERRSETNLMRP